MNTEQFKSEYKLDSHSLYLIDSPKVTQEINRFPTSIIPTIVTEVEIRLMDGVGQTLIINGSYELVTKLLEKLK